MRSVSLDERISFSWGAPSRLKKPPRDLARRVGFLAVLDREGEKWEVGGFVLHGRRHEDDGLAELYEAGPVRETRHPVHFEYELSASELAFDSFNHLFLPGVPPGRAAGVAGGDSRPGAEDATNAVRHRNWRGTGVARRTEGVCSGGSYNRLQEVSGSPSSP